MNKAGRCSGGRPCSFFAFVQRSFSCVLWYLPQKNFRLRRAENGVALLRAPGRLRHYLSIHFLRTIASRTHFLLTSDYNLKIILK